MWIVPVGGGSWHKATGCQWCGSSNTACSKSYTYSEDQSYTYSANFNLGGTAGALSAINGNAGLNFGYSWSSGKSWSETTTCNVNPGDRASIWIRNKMGWSDLAQRYVYGSCVGDQAWGDWWFPHVDWPLNGWGDRETGCSTGNSAEC